MLKMKGNVDFCATELHKYNAVTLFKNSFLIIPSKVAVFLGLSSNFFLNWKPRIFLEPALKGKCKVPKNPLFKKTAFGSFKGWNLQKTQFQNFKNIQLKVFHKVHFMKVATKVSTKISLKYGLLMLTRVTHKRIQIYEQVAIEVSWIS